MLMGGGGGELLVDFSRETMLTEIWVDKQIGLTESPADICMNPKVRSMV